jgi:hypothetical protein
MRPSTQPPTQATRTTPKRRTGSTTTPVIDELPIEYALGRIANRRNAAKKRLVKQ